MRVSFFLPASLWVAVLVGGCAGMKADDPSTPLAGSAWVLFALPGLELAADAPATLRFDAGRAQGSDGCNRFSTNYSAKGSSIEFDARAASTQMACTPAMTRQAEVFKAALQSARAYRVEGDRLTLRSADGTVRVTLVAQPQSLAGTSWIATGIKNGRQAVSSLAAGSTVTLDFAVNGQASGSAGCNRFTAGYQADGAQLRFQGISATRRMCVDDGVMLQEQAFLKALEGVRTMRIEGRRLELRDGDGALMAMFVTSGVP